eukprot:gene19131-biopygen19024
MTGPQRQILFPPVARKQLHWRDADSSVEKLEASAHACAVTDTTLALCSPRRPGSPWRGGISCPLLLEPCLSSPRGRHFGPRIELPRARVTGGDGHGILLWGGGGRAPQGGPGVNHDLTAGRSESDLSKQRHFWAATKGAWGQTIAVQNPGQHRSTTSPPFAKPGFWGRRGVLLRNVAPQMRFSATKRRSSSVGGMRETVSSGPHPAGPNSHNLRGTHRSKLCSAENSHSVCVENQSLAYPTSVCDQPAAAVGGGDEDDGGAPLPWRRRTWPCTCMPHASSCWHGTRGAHPPAVGHIKCGTSPTVECHILNGAVNALQACYESWWCLRRRNSLLHTFRFIFLLRRRSEAERSGRLTRPSWAGQPGRPSRG